LCQQGQGVLVSRQEISERADIPFHFLAKIAQNLARAGYIEIRQGARGGFVLQHEPAAINLLGVVETIIGEIYLNDCIARPNSCKSSYSCAVHRIWSDARDQLRDTLRAVSFDQLTGAESCIPVYQAVPVNGSEQVVAPAAQEPAAR
jgi:Rrf2 family protein